MPTHRSGGSASRFRLAAGLVFLCLRCLGPVLLAVLAVGPLLLRVLPAVAPLFGDVLAVVLPVLARVFAVVVVVVPRVVVHVPAAVPAVRAVVVVVVDGGADRDAGREADHARRGGISAAVVFLNHDRGRRRGLRVDDLRVVLRDVHDLGIGRFNDDDLSPAEVVRVSTSCCAFVFNVPACWACARSRWIALNTADRLEVNASPDARRPVELVGHHLHGLWKQGHRHEARLEAGFRGGILQRGALQVGGRREPPVEGHDVAGAGRAHSICASSGSG